MEATAFDELIGPGVSAGETAWADLGSGTGAFTITLRDLLGPDADIYSVEVDEGRLARQEQIFRAMDGGARTHFLAADFTQPLDLPPLDGLLCANSLHFLHDPVPTLARLRGLLKPTGKLLVVEYAMQTANPWVPYPMPFERLRRIAGDAGYGEPTRLALVQTSARRMYSATVRPA